MNNIFRTRIYKEENRRPASSWTNTRCLNIKTKVTWKEASYQDKTQHKLIKILYDSYFNQPIEICVRINQSNKSSREVASATNKRFMNLSTKDQGILDKSNFLGILSIFKQNVFNFEHLSFFSLTDSSFLF